MDGQTEVVVSKNDTLFTPKYHSIYTNVLNCVNDCTSTTTNHYRFVDEEELTETNSDEHREYNVRDRQLSVHFGLILWDSSSTKQKARGDQQLLGAVEF